MGKKQSRDLIEPTPQEKFIKNIERKCGTFKETARKMLASKDIHITFMTKRGDKMVTNNIDIEATENFNYAICAALIERSLMGDVSAAKFLIERAEGKTPESIDTNLIDAKDETPNDSALKTQQLINELRSRLQNISNETIIDNEL